MVSKTKHQNTTQVFKTVMFWIYAGFSTGNHLSIPAHNGSALAAHDVVLVAVNYRLDAFGWLYWK